jgi:protein tyrosine/serine phosphatase
MNFGRKPLSSLVASFFAVLFLSLAAQAQSAQQQDLSNVHIKNFGQMDERFFRGAQPKENDYQELKGLGVKTVIDLRDDPTSYEKRAVESLGMHYVNIPMVDKAYPRDEDIQAFLKLVDDPSTGKFFVHCAGGRHRTGVMGAVYRFKHYGWNYDQVYAEMKQYDFYTRFGHESFKKYVQAYWDQIQTQHPAAATSVGSNAATARVTSSN